MSDKQRSDTGQSRWDEGIRALINGNVHHESGGTRLHEEEPAQADATIARPARRASGKHRAKGTGRPAATRRPRKRRRAS